MSWNKRDRSAAHRGRGPLPAPRSAATLTAIVAALLAAAVAIGCAGGSVAGGPSADGKLRVVATTTWHSDLARLIGGRHVEVEGLMQPGVDPHLYTARAGDVETLAEADVAVRNGLELEGKMDEVFEHVAHAVPVITVGEALPESERIPIAGSGEYDPHLWFDPSAWA